MRTILLVKNCPRRSVSSLSDARRLLVHILHTVRAPGTTVAAADVRILAFRSVHLNQEETRFLIAIKNIRSVDFPFDTFQFVELEGFDV